MRALKWVFGAALVVLLMYAGYEAQRFSWFEKVATLVTHSSGENDEVSSGIRIEHFTLSNGMQVYLLPNARVPAVSHMLWLRVGAADDPLGKSGLAHFHEHLMFKGTPSVAAGEFTRRIEALGGEFNAFTGADFTGYYVNIAREHLETVMQMESDRMQHLAPAEADYATERDVIIEERRQRIETRPAAQLSEQMQAALFLHHPYRIPVIGWMHEMKQLSAEDAKGFYERYYHAGNMVLVVAGDTTLEELKPLAERYYGSMVAKAPARHDWTAEPPAIAARSVTLRHREIAAPRWQRRYLAPSYGSGDRAQVMPLSLLAQWLGGGNTSLLYQELVEKQQLAVAVSASYSGFSRGPAQFTLSVQPAAGVLMADVEKAVESVLERVQKQPIAPEDLARIKTLFSASAIYARDGLSSMAHYVGYLVMLDLPLDYLTQWEHYVQAVSAEQMQQAAQVVLRPEASVTGYLYPAAPIETQEAVHD